MVIPSSRWGRGPLPALFLHGFTGTADSFGHLEPLLGEALSVRAVTLPGHGGTGFPEVTGPAGLAWTVEALAALLERPTLLVGYSQGARLALALALRVPGLVAGLVLESGTAGLRDQRARAERARADEALAVKLEREGVESFARAWEQHPLFAGVRRLPAAVQEGLRARRTAHAAAGLAWALRSLGQGFQPDLWPALSSLAAPALVLTGALDEQYTAVGRELARALPGARHEVLPEVSHVTHLEAPQAYARAVLDFARGLEVTP